MFGGHLIDVEPGPPFETGHARQPRNDLDVPVEVKRKCLPVIGPMTRSIDNRGGVKHVIVRRVFQRALEGLKDRFERPGELGQQFVRNFGEIVSVETRCQKDFERKPRSEGADRHEVIVRKDNSVSGFQLLADDIAE